MKFFHVTGLEWYSAAKHGIEYDSSTPYISFESSVPLVTKDFWSNVSRSAALLMHYFSRNNLFTYTEVSYLDSSISVQKNIIQFYISMQDFSLVDIS